MNKKIFELMMAIIGSLGFVYISYLLSYNLLGKIVYAMAVVWALCLILKILIETIIDIKNLDK